jgi:hypothetical protein
MKYEYRVEIARPTDLDLVLNQIGSGGWKLFHVQPITTITGVSIQGIPKQELTYQLIFEKPVSADE